MGLELRGFDRGVVFGFQASGAASTNPLTFTHPSCHLIFGAVFAVLKGNPNEHLLRQLDSAKLLIPFDSGTNALTQVYSAL